MARVKIAGLITFFVVAILVFIVFFSFKQYEPDPTLYGFPVPNNTVLLKEHDNGKKLEWARASEENGIPFDYEVALKLQGWKKGEREGAVVEYTKDRQVITLISTTDMLNVLKTPLR